MTTRSRRRAVSVFGVVLGLALAAFPLVTDVWYAWKASQSISEMESSVDYTGDLQRLEQLAQARSMNAVLAGVEPEVPAEDIWPYVRQLTWQTPYMGWLEIPRIAVSMPLYHTTSSEVLAEGAGHVENTSLPVGGVPSHCVVSAHSGLRTARMFDDVRRLSSGDKVCIHTLAEPYAYEVLYSEIVEPDDVGKLHIVERDADMLTLVTCTPLGVNSHRLLVHCTRTEYDPADFENPPAEAYVNGRTVPPFAAGVIVLVVSIVSLVGGTRLRRRGTPGDGGRGE